jgi:hypothetical protein
MSDSPLHVEDDRPRYLKLGHLNSTSIPGSSGEREGDGEVTQAGIKKIEAISTAWTKWSLIVAYFS